MIDSTDTEAQPIEAEHLLQALLAAEKQINVLADELRPFDKLSATLPCSELSALVEGLKRISERVGVCTALADRIATDPEKEADPADVAAADENAHEVADKIFSDDLTGLPTRLIAEKAIESAIGVGRPRYAAVFALDRIQHMSSRYSVDVGNQAIRQCAQFLIQQLPSDSLLFRWHGAVFVSLFDNSGSTADAKLLVEKICVQKLKFTFMTNHRSAMVNLSVSGLTLLSADHSSSDSACQQIDHFVEAHQARQPH